MAQHVRRAGYGNDEQNKINVCEEILPDAFQGWWEWGGLKAVRYSVLQTDKEGRYRYGHEAENQIQPEKYQQ